MPTYQHEVGQPDQICLSYTHDRDYAAYKLILERAKKIHLHPWCPPPGAEYEGFDEVIAKLFGFNSAKDDLQKVEIS